MPASPAQFINNKTFTANYELASMEAARGIIIRLTWKTPKIDTTDLVQFCTKFVELHTDLRSKLNVPPMIILTFPTQDLKPDDSTYSIPLFDTLPKIRQFLAFTRYLRTNNVFVALLNAPEIGVWLVHQFNSKAQNYHSESQAVARYAAWVKELLLD
jgi:hypothetical protein